MIGEDLLVSARSYAKLSIHKCTNCAQPIRCSRSSIVATFPLLSTMDGRSASFDIYPYLSARQCSASGTMRLPPQVSSKHFVAHGTDPMRADRNSAHI
jgi:hypothetical protein